MDKTLQDLVWSILPKEFKEEVKKLYTKFYNEKPHSDCSYGYLGLLIKLFGIDNLTSDAEGEEMLTVPRKDIVELYQEVQKTINQCKGTELAIQAIGIKNTIWSFFGSKCLPDETKDETKEPMPAEPKFKVGDKVRVVTHLGKDTPLKGEVCEIIDIDKGDPVCTYYLHNFSGEWYSQSDLEPYTEPKNKDSELLHAESVENLRIPHEKSHFRNNSPETADCDDHLAGVGNMMDRRLNIAAQITASIYSNDKTASRFDSIEALVRKALDITDTLIAEAERTDKLNK